MASYDLPSKVSLWMAATAAFGLALWGTGLGIGFRFLIREHFALAALSGASGALIMAISHLQRFARSCWNQAHNPDLSKEDGTRALCMWSPFANLLVKPILWPIAGAAVGLIVVAVFYGDSATPSQVIGLAGVSGAGWFEVVKRWEKRN